MHNPAVPNVARTADVVNVIHVPISAPKAATSLGAVIPVVCNARCVCEPHMTGHEDSHPNDAVAVLPALSVEAADAPLQGQVCRVVQARLCAATGAAAAAAPSDTSWDVRVGTI